MKHALSFGFMESVGHIWQTFQNPKLLTDFNSRMWENNLVVILKLGIK